MPTSFQDELPVGLPPVCKGHQFKIDLEDDVPPVHRPLYKLSPLELTEAKKQIEMLLEHQFIRPSESPYGAPRPIRSQEGRRPAVLRGLPLAEQKDDPKSVSPPITGGDV